MLDWTEPRSILWGTFNVEEEFDIMSLPSDSDD
jgi:hypothetical protein